MVTQPPQSNPFEAFPVTASSGRSGELDYIDSTKGLQFVNDPNLLPDVPSMVLPTDSPEVAARKRGYELGVRNGRLMVGLTISPTRDAQQLEFENAYRHVGGESQGFFERYEQYLKEIRGRSLPVRIRVNQAMALEIAEISVAHAHDEKAAIRLIGACAAVSDGIRDAHNMSTGVTALRSNLREFGWKMPGRGGILRSARNSQILKTTMKNLHYDDEAAAQHDIALFADQVHVQEVRWLITGGLHTLEEVSVANIRLQKPGAKKQDDHSFVVGVMNEMRTTLDKALASGDMGSVTPEYVKLLAVVRQRVQAAYEQTDIAVLKLPQEAWLRMVDNYKSVSEPSLQQIGKNLVESGWLEPNSALEIAGDSDQTDVVTPLTEEDQLAQPTPEELAAEAQQQLEELQQRHTELMNSFDQLLSPFRPTMRALRNAGLQALLHDLQIGYDNKRTGMHMDGKTDTEAYQIIATLFGLQGQLNLQDAQKAQLQLVGILEHEHQLVQQIMELRGELRQHGMNGFSPATATLHAVTEWLREHSPALQEVLKERLSSEQATKYTYLLKQLFNSVAATEVSSNETVISPALTLSDEIEPATVTDVVAEADATFLAPSARIPLRETDVALQLDWEVFPPDVTVAELKLVTEETFRREQTKDIDWQRIQDLITLAQTFDGKVYRSKPRSLGTVDVPYFVAEIVVSGKQFAVAENPEYGNASYVLRTDLAEYGATWKQVFEQGRQLARLLGARKVVHSAATQQLDRILTKFQELLLIQPKNSAE